MTSKLKTTEILEKYTSIRYGAVWFARAGRYALYWGMINAVLGALIIGIFAYNKGIEFYFGFTELFLYIFSPFVSNVLAPILLGYLFLLGSRAFESIEALISDMNEIV